MYLEVPAEMSFPQEVVVTSLWLLTGPSRKCAPHLAQLMLSNGRTMKSSPSPSPFELLMARCKRLSNHISTKPSEGALAVHTEMRANTPFVKTPCVLCNGFEPLLHRKAEKSVCFPQWGGFHRRLHLAVLADMSTLEVEEERWGKAYDSRQCLLYLTAICSCSACYYWML